MTDPFNLLKSNEWLREQAARRIAELVYLPCQYWPPIWYEVDRLLIAECSIVDAIGINCAEATEGIATESLTGD